MHPLLAVMQDTLNSNDVSDAVRNRIMAFYRYKYRKGKIPLQQQIYGELPYDMQVSVAAADKGCVSNLHSVLAVQVLACD